jgi:sentrin-specific protease 1
MHWVCAVAYMQEKRIQFYDSMGDDGMDYLKAIYQYIKDEHKDKKKAPFPDEDKWQLIPCTRETPRQLNGTSPSILVCFCDYLLLTMSCFLL